MVVISDAIVGRCVQFWWLKDSRQRGYVLVRASKLYVQQWFLHVRMPYLILTMVEGKGDVGER